MSGKEEEEAIGEDSQTETVLAIHIFTKSRERRLFLSKPLLYLLIFEYTLSYLTFARCSGFHRLGKMTIVSNCGADTDHK